MARNSKVHISMVKSRVKESISGQMVALTKDNGTIIELRGLVSINGPMVVSMKVLSRTAKCLVKVLILGQMVGPILVHT